jgi:DNA polymerase bacteriophage-type
MSPPIVFFDFETRSKCDLSKEGVDRYARDPSTQIFVVSAKFPDGRYGVWAPEWARAGLECTGDWIIDEWNKHVEEGTFFCAWNTQFDRTVLLYADEDFPLRALPIKQTIDAMAQAENYSLPGSLGKAADILRVPTQKDARGKRLIRILCNGHQPWEPDPADIADFWAYAMKDTLAMAEVWHRCRKWSADEWANYHTLERINERGILVDIEFAEAAVQYSADEMEALNGRLREVTGDDAMTLSHSKRKLDWLYGMVEGTDLEESMWTITTRKRTKVRAKSVGRPVQRALKDRYDYLSERDNANLPTPENWKKVEEFLSILDAGNGVASKKFAKMLQTHVDGRLYHQFRCSPTITGRHAARGVQFDNVLRDGLADPGNLTQHPAIYAIEMLMNAPEGVQRALEGVFGLPINKIMARLIRPSIMAPDGHWLVWGDWSSVEARVIAWLAKAERYLNLFREGKSVYVDAASGIYNKKPEDITKDERLVGKVATLALDFQGGVNALMAMARGYELSLDPEFAKHIVGSFRENNPWLTRYWRKLDDAVWQAMSSPGAVVKAGRLRYIRQGSDLFCFLPCGRPVVYPDVKIQEIYKERFDATMDVITYRKVWSGQAIRGEIYPGILIENATQASAASLLHWLLKKCDAQGMEVWAPKHDEVLLCSKEPELDARRLKMLMEVGPMWAEGLPLEAEVETGSFYGK